MSYAIQCLEESILNQGGYVDELMLYKKQNKYFDYVFTAIEELIIKGLISKEYYKGNGHKVLGKLKDNSNIFEVDSIIENDNYLESYYIDFDGYVIEDELNYKIKIEKYLYVGDKKSSIKFANELKNIYKNNLPYSKISSKVYKNENKK